MNYKKCPNNHFYDPDQYTTCPFCAGGSPTVNETVSFSPSDSDARTMPIRNVEARPTVPLPSSMEPDKTTPLDGLDDQKTVAIYGSDLDMTSEPVVGWLICTKGKHKGKDFKLKAGRNFIGRGQDMDVLLTGEKSVSRDRHAVIVYEPIQNVFMVMPGDAKELFYLDGDVVLSTMRLSRGNRIQIGEVELRFVPCCDDDFTWEKG